MNNELPPRKAIPTAWKNSDEIYLHLGENPFSPTADVMTAIHNAAQRVNRYPDTNATILRQELAKYTGHDVTPKNIITGNGSDELIDLTVVTFTEPENAVLTFEPTFFVYSFCAKRHARSHLPIRQDDDFSLPGVDDFLAPQNTGLTFIANPNNPTGTLYPREILVEFIQKLPGIVVIDECYFEFSSETVVDLVHEHKNLVVLRSLSKSFGLSGLRLGYAVAHEETIDRMERHAMTFPVNAIAQAAGIAALQDREIYYKHIDTITAQRDEMRKRLLELGYSVLPSATNFILLLPDKKQYPSITTALEEQMILVSDQSANVGKPALRIAVGSDKENKRVLSVFKDLAQPNGGTHEMAPPV